MKKVFLSVLLIAGFTSFSHAQGVKLGIRAGVNLTNYAGAGKEDLEDFYQTELMAKLSFHGGLLLNIPLNSKGFFSFQPELLYSQRGYQFGFEADGQIFGRGPTQIVRDHYLDLPILARLNTHGLIFEAGPQLDYLVATKTIYETRSLREVDTQTDGYNRFGVGYVMGIGYQFSSGPSVTIRHNGGISSIMKDVPDERKTRHTVFQFSLGYVFGGKRP